MDLWGPGRLEPLNPHPGLFPAPVAFPLETVLAQRQRAVALGAVLCPLAVVSRFLDP